jgi:hypothetical protein
VTRPTFQAIVHQPDESLAVELGHHLHLVEQLALLTAASFKISFLHEVKILPAFVNRHWVLDGHRSLGNIII